MPLCGSFSFPCGSRQRRQKREQQSQISPREVIVRRTGTSRTTTFRPGLICGLPSSRRHETGTPCGQAVCLRGRLPESIEFGGTARVSQWILENFPETLEPEAGGLPVMLMERELEQRNREWRKRDIAQQQLPIRSRVLQSFIDRKDGKPAAAGMSSGVPNARTPSLADRRHTQNAPRSIGWGHLTAPTVASGSTGRCCALPARYRCPWWRLEGERELPKFVTDLFGVPEAGQSRREHQEQPSSTCSEETPSQNVSSERMATLQNEPWDLPSADPRRDSQRPHPVKGTNTNGQEVDTNTQFREISPSNGEHGFKEAWWELERDHESNDDGTIESDGTQGPGRDDCEMPQKLETEEDGDTLSENMQEQDTGP